MNQPHGYLYSPVKSIQFNVKARQNDKKVPKTVFDEEILVPFYVMLFNYITQIHLEKGLIVVMICLKCEYLILNLYIIKIEKIWLKKR